jgi:heme/copper-type cytochrome/quinol oxidase subunit 2
VPGEAPSAWPSPYPSEAPPSPQAGWGGPSSFAPPPAPTQPARPAAVWQGIVASAAVVLVVVAHFWEVSRLSHVSALLQDAEAGEQVTASQVRTAEDSLRASGSIIIGMIVIAGILVMVWTYRARLNAEAYTSSEFRRSRPWAIWGWICPVVALWFPYQVVKDIWAASDTQRPSTHAIKPWRVTAILPLWWTCLLGASLVSRISGSVYNAAETPSGIHTALVWDFASAAIDIAAAILFILIVAAVTRFQSERYEAARASWQGNGQPA